MTLYVFFIACGVSFAFLNVDTIAVFDIVAYPAGDILGGRIEVEDIVETCVVKTVIDKLFDVGEVCHHAVSVQLGRAAMDGHYPVVAVERRAFTLIVKCKSV